MKNNIINISAAIIINHCGELLLVRKQHSCFFMQAGGKIEMDESPLQALIRELQEELNLYITASDCNYVGKYSAPAANETNYYVNASLFSIVTENIHFTPQAELAEVGWYSTAQAEALVLAPLTRDIILPLTIKGGV